MPTPNAVDVAVIICLVIGGIQGFVRGLSGELAQLVSAIAGFGTGIWVYVPISRWVLKHARLDDDMARAAAFAAAMVVAVVLMLVIRYAFKKIISGVIQEKFDKATGAVAGILRAGIFTMMFLILMNLWPHAYINKLFGSESIFGTIAGKAMPHIILKAEAIGDAAAAKNKEAVEKLDEPVPVTDTAKDEKL